MTKPSHPTEPTEKYINPFTDYGFKRIFGEEPSKDLLKDFLNDLLHEEQGEITEIQYLNSEQLGDTQYERKAFFDLYCTNEKGERFIVELQKAKQNFFKDRTVYYSTFPIREQAKRGLREHSSCLASGRSSAPLLTLLRDFEPQTIYNIAILDFVFDEDKDKPNKYLYNVKLTDQESKEIFYDKLTFVYLSMPKFTKELADCHTHLEKFLYILKNLTKFQSIPEELTDEKFVKLFKIAEVAKLNQQEYYDYEASLKEYWDFNAYYNTAHKEGREEGIEEGREKGREEGIEIGMELGVEKGMELGVEKEKKSVAKNLKQLGLDNQSIANATGLAIEIIETL